MRKFLMIALNTVALLGLASMAFAANQLDSAALGYTCLAAALGIGIAAFGCGIGMETISKWGPWMDLVSIYIIPIGATLGAVSWFYVMKKDELLDAVNPGSGRTRGALWYGVGRYVYVPIAVVLCCVALFKHISF